MNFSNTFAWSAALSAVFLVCGCETKVPETATSPSAAVGRVDWSKVNGADVTVAMDALCRVCRLADVHHKGSMNTLTLRYAEGGGGATDGDGRFYRASPEEWKGIAALIGSSHGGVAAARAQPAKSKSYADGLGAAGRFAYEARTPDQGTLMLTVVKPLSGDSGG